MTARQAAVGPEGTVNLRVIKGGTPESLERPEVATKLTMRDVLRYGLPQSDQHPDVQRWKAQNARNLFRGLQPLKLMVAHGLKMPTFVGSLYARVLTGAGDEIDLGLVSVRVVTTAGVNFLVDAFQGSVEPELFRYHGIGTGTTAAAVGDTGLQTELTTEYNPNSTRATGTLTEGASANIFRTVGTNTLDSGTPAVTEHGILTQAATGGGTLLDRHVFSAINLDGTQGDGLQTTYDLTISAGG